MAEQVGKVYLVGSGPGDAAYLTLQAQEILAQADVLVYDALVDGDLIDLVPDSCLKLDVGKRGGQPSTPQSEINRLLVDHCLQGKQVVRLKNGDPFIFGRAQAEIGALKKADCEFEIIPGLSSALVAPLMAGIPLTDPQLSNGFTVVTAHDPDALNWVSLAKLDTLVFLMGGRTLPEIVRRLRGHGRSPYTPVAVIRYTGRSNQQIWEGALNNILDRTAGVSLSPCVIVIGEVVKLRAYVGEQGRKNKGAREQGSNGVDEWMGSKGSREAREDGEGSQEEQTPLSIRKRGASDFSQIDSRIESSKGASKQRPLDERNTDRRERRILNSNSELETQNSEPVLLNTHAEANTQNLELETQNLELAPSLLPLSAKTILVTRAANQSSQFTNLLQEQGARVIEMPTLEIVPPSSWRDLDRAIAQIDDFDWLILTSTNGVDYFFQRLEEVTGDRFFSTNIKIAVVGEKTAQRLARLGMQPDFIPPNFVADSLATNFPEPLAGLRVLFPRVESGGREMLVKEFTSQGAKVREVAAYESRCPDAIAPTALRTLQSGNVDVVTFASSKTVQHFCQLLQQENEDWQRWLGNVAIASIGPQTSKACIERLGRVDVEATEYTLDGLTVAIAQWVTSKPVEEPASEVPPASESMEEPASEVPLAVSEPTEPFSETDSATLNLTAPPETTEFNATVAEPTLTPPITESTIDNAALLDYPISEESVIEVELVPNFEATTDLDSVQAELAPAELATAEVELIAEIQAVIEQGETDHPSDRPTP